MTQIASPERLNANTENQSIAAAALRCRVGSAKAASAASGGTASISARSEPPITMLASSATPAQPSGTEMCRCSQWLRQRHSVGHDKW